MLYLYEVGDSGEKVVEGDLGLAESSLDGCVGDSLTTPGAHGGW